MRSLLVGMGNPILTDDAVGIRLAADIAQRLGYVPGLDVVSECCVGGLNLIEILSGYQRIILLDSIRTPDGVPGCWYHFDSTTLAHTIHLAGIHDANLATALELGRLLGVPIADPTEIHILAVEVDDNSTFSEQLSPALETGYKVLAEEILAEVRRLLEL